MLYDADRHREARASVEDPQDLYQAQLDVFLDPNDAEVQAQARARRRARGMARGGAGVAGLQDGDRVEDRVPAASRSTARCRWSGTCRRCRRSSRQPTPANRRRWRCRTCAACAFRCAISPTCSPPATKSRSCVALERMLAMRAFFRERQLSRRRDNLALLQRVGPDEAQVRRDAPLPRDRQLRGSLRHSDDAPRIRRGCVRPAQRMRIQLRQRLLGRSRAEPVRRQDGRQARVSDPRARRRWPRKGHVDDEYAQCCPGGAV